MLSKRKQIIIKGIALRIFLPEVDQDFLVDVTSILCGSLSVISLVAHGFGMKVLEPVEALLQNYENYLTKAFFIVRQFSILVSSLFHIHIEIQEVSKNLMVLITLYIIRHAGNIAKKASIEKDRSFKRRLLATLAAQAAALINSLTLFILFVGAFGKDESILSQLFYTSMLTISILIYDLFYIAWHTVVLLPSYNKHYCIDKSRITFIRERVPEAFRRDLYAWMIGATCLLLAYALSLAHPFVVGSLGVLITTGIFWGFKSYQITCNDPSLFRSVGLNIDSMHLSASILKPMIWGFVAALSNYAVRISQ